MTKLTKSIVAAFIAAGAVSISHAEPEGNSATHTVSIAVAPINQISVQGNPSLLITQATAGGAPVPVTDSTSTYAITTNEVDRKIVAQLNLDLPNGVTLRTALEAPNGASSIERVLSTVPVEVVTGISTLNQSGLGINYTLTATSAAGVVEPISRQVTYTILADAS